MKLKNKIIVVALFIGIGLSIVVVLSYVPTLVLSVESISIPRGENATRYFDFPKGTEVKGLISVKGGTDEIRFWISDPQGNDIIPEGVIQSTADFEFVAQIDGKYVFNFDNSHYTFTDKQVTLNFDLVKPPLLRNFWSTLR